MSICDNHSYWTIDGEFNSITEEDMCPAYREDGTCAYGCDNSTYIEECPKGYAPILRALPGASEEQIRTATLILIGKSCDRCSYDNMCGKGFRICSGWAELKQRRAR